MTWCRDVAPQVVLCASDDSVDPAAFSLDGAGYGRQEGQVRRGAGRSRDATLVGQVR